eukprot:CAMPEP_0194167866 /NCGR_PEP_ID=MMETSP0154-20130528/3013_1 /TAXON_ID=1049557 /ORGANISM="Thalassiothrix antarctica, Strain L6-D1" /LENGTH=451 /DNA_ID=CAMNT_0038878865 /DNA_START=1 /DNA_END=1356 /DNA_ORIENTATION=-
MGTASSKSESDVIISSSTALETTLTDANRSSSVNNSACPYKDPGNDKSKKGGGFMGCPVQHNKKNKNGITKYNEEEKQKKEALSYKNVYSQDISQVNNMPSQANQLPAPQQEEELSTERIPSTIPKIDGKDKWVYPSPQMFYNALVRKNKLDDDTTEEDMESVVALHNNMNERTWKQVLEWEKISGYNENCRLLKFMGRPSELSPKARLKHYLLGHPLPFDRHDWTIVREDGMKVRYVIDYYHDDTKSSEEEGSGMPSLTDKVESLLVDVRPAIDSPLEFYQRAIALPYALYLSKEKTELEILPLRPSPTLETQVEESQNVWENVINSKTTVEGQLPGEFKITKEEAKELAIHFGIALQECEASQNKVSNCHSDMECQQAALDVLQCYGKLWCPLQHKALLKSLNDTSEEGKFEAALDHLNMCVISTQSRMGEARIEYPTVWEKVPHIKED